MKDRLPGMPGPFAHAVSLVLTLLLTLCLLLSAVSLTAWRVLSDSSLHESVALDPAVTDAQMARITEKVTSLAEKYSFDPSPVLALVTRESVEAYSREVIAWWMGILSPNADLTAPRWACDALEETIRQDPLFQENTPSGRQKSVARDKCAGGVITAVTNAVLPIRTELISFALTKVLGRVDAASYAAYLPYLAPVFGLCALVLCAALMLLMSRRLVKCLCYIGAGLAGSGIVLFGVMGALALLRLTERVSETSALLGMQTALLTGRLALQTGLIAGACLVVGLIMIGVHQHSMMKLRRGLAQAGMDV